MSNTYNATFLKQIFASTLLRENKCGKLTENHRNIYVEAIYHENNETFDELS